MNNINNEERVDRLYSIYIGSVGLIGVRCSELMAHLKEFCESKPINLVGEFSYSVMDHTKFLNKIKKETYKVNLEDILDTGSVEIVFPARAIAFEALDLISRFLCSRPLSWVKGIQIIDNNSDSNGIFNGRQIVLTSSDGFCIEIQLQTQMDLLLSNVKQSVQDGKRKEDSQLKTDLKYFIKQSQFVEEAYALLSSNSFSEATLRRLVAFNRSETTIEKFPIESSNVPPPTTTTSSSTTATTNKSTKKPTPTINDIQIGDRIVTKQLPAANSAATATTSTKAISRGGETAVLQGWKIIHFNDGDYFIEAIELWRIVNGKKVTADSVSDGSGSGLSNYCTLSGFDKRFVELIDIEVSLVQKTEGEEEENDL